MFAFTGSPRFGGRPHPALMRSDPVRTIDGETFITVRPERSGGFYERTSALLRRYRVRIAETIETPDVETCVALVACGMGVSLVSAVAAVSLAVEGIAYRALAPTVTVETMALAWRRDRAATPAIRAFVEYVCDANLRFLLSRKGQ